MNNDDTISLKKFAKTDKRTQQSLRQFLSIDGPKGNSPAYDRGYEYTFRFSDDEKREVLWIMEEHKKTFDEAFDIYMEFKRNK